MRKELRCIHRHTVAEHPQCFLRGLVKQIKGEKLLEKNYEDPFAWYEECGLKVGYFDIETAGDLSADFSVMLSWAIKERGGETRYDYITKKELFDLKFDERIVRSCLEELKKYGVIVTYYGTGFDIPYLRSKALFWGLDFPGYIAEIKTLRNGDKKQVYNPQLYHWDLYFTVKSKLRLSRKSLDNACYYLGIEGKTPLDKRVWMLARYGHKESIDKVVEHNIADVEILEKLHNRLVTFKKWIQSPA